MPYQLVAAKARLKSLDAVWEDVDLSAVDINEIYRTYRRVILTLSHTVVSGTFYLDLQDARQLVGNYTGYRTLPQWLTSMGNATLPTLSQAPTYRLYPARYTDIYRANYKTLPFDRTRHPDAQLPHRAKNDLLISGRGVDFRSMWTYCMITVNGFVHRVSGSREGLVVVDGGRTGRISKSNHVGLTSFRDVGALTYVPITANMVYKQNPAQRYADYAMVKLPMDISNKTVMLVLGGYLHVLDKAYYITGDRQIRIDLSALQLPDRIYDSIDKIDLSSLGLTASSNNPKHFALDDLFSDRAMLAYLTLPQSFFIVMDKTDLYVRRHIVEQTRNPGRYITEMPLKQFPLLSAYGRLYDYAPFPERGKCVLATDFIKQAHRTYHTYPWEDGVSVDPTSYPSDPWFWAQAFLLEIGRVA